MSSVKFFLGLVVFATGKAVDCHLLSRQPSTLHPFDLNLSCTEYDMAIDTDLNLGIGTAPTSSPSQPLASSSNPEVNFNPQPCALHSEGRLASHLLPSREVEEMKGPSTTQNAVIKPTSESYKVHALYNADIPGLGRFNIFDSSNESSRIKKPTLRDDLQVGQSQKRLKTSSGFLSSFDDHATASQHFSGPNLLSGSKNTGLFPEIEVSSGKKQLAQKKETYHDETIKNMKACVKSEASTSTGHEIQSSGSLNTRQQRFGMFDFDEGVFQIPIEFQTDPNKAKTSRLIETMLVGKQLFINKEDPVKALYYFKDIYYYTHHNVLHENSKHKIEKERKHIRKALKIQVMQELVSKKQLWLKFWAEKTEYFEILHPTFPWNIEGVQESLIWFLYYIDMITSIIVEPHEMVSKPRNNSKLIMIAIDTFVPFLQELEILKLNRFGKWVLLRFNMNYHFTNLVKKWSECHTEDPEIARSLSGINKILQGSRMFSRAFFNFVFSNSFISMSQRLSIMSKDQQ